MLTEEPIMTLWFNAKCEVEFDLMMDDFYMEKYKLKKSNVSFMNGGY